MLIVKKYNRNPIISPCFKEKEASTYNPGAVVDNNKVFLFYRSEKGVGERAVSKINLALSRNGFSFKNYSQNPVIKPERPYEKRGCEDPRVLKINNGYFLTYTAYEGRDKKGDYKVKLLGALSTDLFHWKKTTPLIPQEKSGAIVRNYKYKEKYVMYFGGKKIKIAFSRDLRSWEVAETPVLFSRKGDFFDNHLLEAGPPPVVTKKGILLIYNGKSRRGKFSIGYAILDKNDPSKVIKRSKRPILEPTEYWEKFGKINNVVFATGLVRFRRRWLLYYGGADKGIGVAILNF